MTILVICTGNSCRSQMAEGFLKSFDPRMNVFSAGTKPEKIINPYAVMVMKEAGIDISSQIPKSIDLFINEEFDYVITVCDNAKVTCPFFIGKVSHRLHQDFEDPAMAKGSEENVLQTYRKVRDQIEKYFKQFYTTLK
jgi:arsenate reductase (thioredoxin)